MQISASIQNSFGHHNAVVATNGAEKQVQLASKDSGYGSAVNGGEMLLLALATCYCNDIYREAALRNIQVKQVDVACYANFGGPGDPGTDFRYEVRITSEAPQSDIDELIRYTDSIAEIHNTLRGGVSVNLVHS